MSHAHAGYIEGLDDFVSRCPEFRAAGYAAILSYLTVRGVLKAAAQGRFGVVSAEMKAWRKAANLPGRLRALAGYFAGRRQRQRLSLNQAAATTSAE